ncbi:hypothetical protein Cyast_0019 [Cyanobacterium stanieri PCC 7202]|uniref:Uncharacterized protein n=1 Tax=Cyanobacterium stanieri (strain ATCC 29140 / PCC 7202) TaxID=292563 RepID=K9YGL8_CYASC|nr:hypothetical protein Cyast_0019 [Cyanobacterium stanieri PCC 7202]
MLYIMILTTFVDKVKNNCHFSDFKSNKEKVLLILDMISHRGGEIVNFTNPIWYNAKKIALQLFKDLQQFKKQSIASE